MAYPCGVACNLLWIPRWCRPCPLQVPCGATRTEPRAQPCAKPDGPRSAHTRSSFARTRAAGWWSLRLRLAGASARKPWTLCSGWRGRVREVCRLVCFARRWSSSLAAGASRAYAASLLALPAHSAAGVDGPPPLVSDVPADGGEPFAAHSRVR